MDKALKQAKPQLQVSAKDGKVIIIGNQEGLDLLGANCQRCLHNTLCRRGRWPGWERYCHLCHAVFAARCPGARARG